MSTRVAAAPSPVAVAPAMALPDNDSSTTPESVIDFPGMISTDEKRILYWIAKNHYSGKGIIVDAGIFLGASTNAFATGLRSNSSLKLAAINDKPIVSYDIAIWVSSMDQYLENEAVQAAIQNVRPQYGESFRGLLERLLAPHADLVELRVGDILQLASTERPVEIAFYDCLKSFERDQVAFRAFGPHYIPGQTIVIQQDYFYESAPDLKIRQEFLSPYFTFLGGVQDSALFRLDCAIPESYFRTDPILSLSLSQKVYLLKQAVGRAPTPRKIFYTSVCVIEYMIKNGLHDAARAEFDVLMAGVERPERLFGPRVLPILKSIQRRLAA